jgi:hypothetical protein
MPDVQVSERVLFVKIGWMLEYSGQKVTDPLCSNMGYPKRKGKGWEDFNFAECNGSFYGYITHNNGGMPDFAKIDSSVLTETLDNVLVVFVASWPNHSKKQRRAFVVARKESAVAEIMAGKQVVIGWYPTTTLFPRCDQKNPNSGTNGKYSCTERASRGKLLPIPNRCWRVPGGRTPGAFSSAKFMYYDPSIDWQKAILVNIAQYEGNLSGNLPCWLRTWKSLSLPKTDNDRCFGEKWIQSELTEHFQRNSAVARSVRNRAKGICSVCNTNVLNLYGYDVIEAHHKAGSPPKTKRNIRVKDLVPLCPSCHRALHRYSGNSRKPISLAVFRRKMRLT